jgi:RNA polymerase sigma-70 factor, ECF subfamily
MSTALPARDTAAAPLAERFARREASAVREVHERWSPSMFATAMALLGDRSLAADAVQQAFVQAWLAADRFDPAQELTPWLYAITRRVAVDVHRRERRGGRPLSLDDGRLADLPVESASLDEVWQSRQVQHALDQLRPDEREVLRLAYFDQLTHREISIRLGIAMGTVKSRSSRALRRLATLLGHLRDHHSGANV